MRQVGRSLGVASAGPPRGGSFISERNLTQILIGVGLNSCK
jgi:hypothetical protein